MKYSQLFGKSLRKVPKDTEAISHKLLVKGGFIDQLAAGIYSFLPLGWRVHQKIENIIREEMNAIGGQEVFLPTLQPKELWERSNRWEHMDPPLWQTEDRHRKEYALGPTHEEVMTDLAVRFIKSYKDLPLSLYQIQNKFRNEMRSTGGLLRTREFMMKDLYSFHENEKDLDEYYQKVHQAYLKIFKRCGFEAIAVEAESGSIGGDVCHEFMMACSTGEDKILVCEQCGWASSVNLEKRKKTCPRCHREVKEVKGIENGHIFKLGTLYSEKMGAFYTDKEGKKKPIYMGCYGIGLGRLMATIVEASHDQKGIIWPEGVAPFQAHLISADPKSQKLAERVYDQLFKAEIEVLYDDREVVTAGVKFTDADLIGIPVRLVVSEKTKDKIEWKKRKEKKTELLSLQEIIKKLQ
ncbi:MAG: proline--tRNA ligase [Candidatus Marinimicrobia bacterium]|nr:proline--tRNA ligase [Candidatus Neomarinimicrobiota bacterium]